MTLTLAGGTLTARSHIDATSVDWKTTERYTPAIHPGADFEDTLGRTAGSPPPTPPSVPQPPPQAQAPPPPAAESCPPAMASPGGGPAGLRPPRGGPAAEVVLPVRLAAPAPLGEPRSQEVGTLEVDVRDTLRYRGCCALGQLGASLLDPDLGARLHQYGAGGGLPGFSGDPVGFVYTARAGLVDVGHVRHDADVTRFVYLALLAGKGKPVSLRLFEGNAAVAKVPTDNEALLELAGAIAYADSWAHEINTFGDVGGFFPTDFSSFSPEDLPSNMIGIEVSKRAIRRLIASPGAATDDAAYNAAMDRELPALLTHLGAQPASETGSAFLKMIGEQPDCQGPWYVPGGRWSDLLRRNFDGRPWFAGMPYDQLANIDPAARPRLEIELDPAVFKLDTRRDLSYSMLDGASLAEMKATTQSMRDTWVKDHPGGDQPGNTP